MSIFTQRMIKIAGDKANMSSDIHIYRGNRNIELVFTITDHAFRFTTTENSGSVIEAYSPSHGYVTLLTPLGTELCSGKAAIKDDKLVFKITKAMIDEHTEVGDYDLVIDLYDEAGDALLTLPAIYKQIHILERVSLVNDPTEDPVVFNKDTSDLSVGDSATYTANDGNIGLSQVITYNPETDELVAGRPKAVSVSDRIKSINGIPICDAEVRDIVNNMNNVFGPQIKDIPKDLLLEDGKMYLKKGDGTKLGAGVVLPVSGTGLTTEQIRQLQQAHTHSTSPHAPSNAQKNSDITKAEIEAKLTGEIVTHTHPGMITAKSYVTYEEFGAKSDGVNDDGAAIKLAHEHANQNNLIVKPDPTKTYYIKQAHSIPIINSTNFNNATFVIDDTVEVDRKKNVFEVKSKKEPITIDDLNFTVERSTVKLSNLSGHGLCLVQVINANKKQFIREGSNSNEGTDQQDYFVIDNEGSVLTDIIWDFEQITSCTLYPFDDTTLIMKNAKFITRSNGKELQTNYFDRGLTVNRSNVILENINHRVENEQPGSPYHGFISGRYCAYLTLRNCSVQSRKAYKVSGTSVWMGSYDIEMYCVVGVKLENVVDVTFDNKERWGVFASNFCKDIVVEDSTLSRVDAHQGARNITIRRSVIGNQGLRIIGSGLCLVEDTKILNSTSLITLRNDYGSNWDGTLIMKKIYWQPDSTYAYPRIINFSNSSNHDFGYTCYFPRLIIDDLEVDDTELLSNDSYSNIPIINNNTAVFGTDITSFTHPYHFTDNIECKNMRTKSDKGFILFNSSTINLYNKKPFTYKVLESTSVNNKKLLITPNTKIVLDNVKLAKVSRRMNASGNLFAILDVNGNNNDGFTNNTNHVLPLIQIKNCENVYAFTSNHPMVLELEDSVVDTLLNVGMSTRMNGKATGCSFKPSIDGVYQSVNTNYGDFTFTNCKFDTPLINGVEEKTPTNLVKIYSFLGSYDPAKNNYNLIDTIMDNCSIWDGTRCLALGTINDAPAGIIIKKVTQQQYDSESHDTNTLYIIVG